jgi:hypothetical protein
MQERKVCILYALHASNVGMIQHLCLAQILVHCLLQRDLGTGKAADWEPQNRSHPSPASLLSSEDYLSVQPKASSEDGPPGCSESRMPAHMLDINIMLRETLNEMLRSACTDFAFDIGTLRDASNDHAVPYLVLYILTMDTSIALDLGIDLKLLTSFLLSIESHYNDHHYHNKTHAADVLQMLHVIVKRSLRSKGIANAPLSQLSYVIAAAVHDVDHYGKHISILCAFSWACTLCIEREICPFPLLFGSVL